jgi:chemotaxis signal transduction protein
MAKDRAHEHRSGRRRREHRAADAVSDSTVASGAAHDATGPWTGPELPDLGVLAQLGPHPDVTADPALGLGLPDVASLLAHGLERMDPSGQAVEGTPVRPPDDAGAPEPPAGLSTDTELPDLSALASLPLGEADSQPAWRDAEALPAPALELDRLGRAAVDSEPGDECVVFTVAGARFAVPLGNVAQVGEVGHVTRVPNTPGWIAGVIGWRENVISLIDMPTLLGQPSDVPGGHVVVVHTDEGEMAAGLLVERLGRIERYAHGVFRDDPLAGALGRIARGAYRPDPTEDAVAEDIVAVDVSLLLAVAWPDLAAQAGA